MPNERKKRKTVVVSSSEDEETSERHIKAREQKLQGNDKLKTIRNGHNSEVKTVPKRTTKAKPSQSTASPRKSKTNPVPQERSIFSFFNAASQKQRRTYSASPEKDDTTSVTFEEEDDMIQDDDSPDGKPRNRPQSTLTAAYSIPERKKRKSHEVDGQERAESQLPRGSQLFRQAEHQKASDKSYIASTGNDDLRPWTERFGPVSTEELAVHKKKVQDVHNWLDLCLSGRSSKSLLVLKGPAGSGKSTTVNLISQEMKCTLQEWRNPEQTRNSEQGYVSVSAQFEDFVARAGTFGTLTLDTRNNVQDESKQHEERTIVLIEEFPNTFAKSSTALHSFRSSVLQCLGANTPRPDIHDRNRGGITPVVMIISETLLSTSTAAADSFTAHRLLGGDILGHPSVSVIEFNPVAPTFMTKALELVLRKESRKSGRRKAPGTAVLDRLAKLGDIRNAVSSLEFLCLHGDDYDGWSGKITFSKGRKINQELSRKEAESLESITQRESALGIFHSIGKVMYNKRNAPKTVPSQPPAHLPQCIRTKTSEVDVESLLNELGADIQTFVAGLHENYVLSCQGIDAEETLDTITACLDVLSEADLLAPDRFGPASHRTLQGVPGDRLRQDEMSFYTSVQGLLFNLPHPVKRISPPSGLYGDRNKSTRTGSAGHQMYYPKSMQLWRHVEENEQLLETISTAMRAGPGLSATALNSNAPNALGTRGVESWKRNSSQIPPVLSGNDDTRTNTMITPPLIVHMSKPEMLLERLPFMAIITKQPQSRTSDLLFRNIDRLVRINHHQSLVDDETDEGSDNDDADEWSTDKAVAGFSRSKPGFSKRKEESSSAVTAVQEKASGLVLSDDDIEDD